MVVWQRTEQDLLFSPFSFFLIIPCTSVQVCGGYYKVLLPSSNYCLSWYQERNITFMEREKIYIFEFVDYGQ